MAHAAHKVTVGGGHAALARGQDAHIAAQAGSAGGGGDHGARVDEGGDIAPLDALPVDLHGGGDDDAAYPRGHGFAIENPVRGFHILHTAVGAAADDHLIDLNIA